MLEILEQLGPWVSYPPRLAKCLGGVKEAIFLTHILWWKKRSEDGWVFRTREDIERDTGLSRWEQETARRNLRQLGVLREEYRGIPRRLFFYVDMGKLDEVWKSFIESSPEPAPMPVDKQVEIPPTSRLDSRQQAGGNTSDKQVEIPPTSRLDSRQQAGGNTSDYLVISLEKSNNISKNIKEISDDLNHKQLENRTRLKGVIEELKNAIKPDESIPPKEFEEPLLIEMLRAGFPRKSLRSKIDRENLETLRIHLGATTYDQLAGFFEKLAILRQKGFLVEWDWEKILKRADYIATYEPMPEIDFNKYDNWQALLTFFKTQKPPAKYVRKIVWDWWRFYKFTDVDYNWVEKFIAKIMREVYGINEKENSNGNVHKVL